MSRIGRLPIAVPSGVEVTIEGRRLTVKGPKGTLTRDLHPDMTVSREDGQLVVTRPTEQKTHKQLHGLTRTLVNNMVVGVTDGYRKGLEITRRRLPRLEGRREAPAEPGLQPPDRDRPARRASASRSRTRPASRSSASTRSSSARSRPASGRRASPSPTRARASATPASRSAARPARPARSAARSNPSEGTNEMTQVASRGAARRKRHDRIRLRLEGTESRPRLAVFRSNNHIYAQVIDDGTGQDARRRVDRREGAPRLQADEDRGGGRRRAPGRRAGEDRRRRARRLRSSRVPVPRADQVARRCRPRSRPRLLIVRS